MPGDELARLRAIAAHTPDAIGVYALDGRALYVNPAAERLFGRGKALLPDSVRQAFERVAHGGAPEACEDYFAALEKWLDVRIERFDDEIHVIARDVTEERRGRRHLETLARSLERTHLLRLEQILGVSARLTAATEEAEIARTLVDEGIAALDAKRCFVYLLSSEGRDVVLASQRGFRSDDAAAFARVLLAAKGPVSDCVREGRTVWVDSRSDYAARYPDLEGPHRPPDAPPLAFIVSPLAVEGRAVGCFGIVLHDERKVTEDERRYVELIAAHGAEALRRTRLYANLRDVSETREAMIQASPAGIMLLDPQGTVQVWNPAAERIFGWPASEVLGKKVPIGGDRTDEVLAVIAEVIAGNVIHGREVVRVRRSGEAFPLELYAARARLSGGGPVCLSVVVDITERKRLERGRQVVADASAALTRSLEWRSTLDELARLTASDLADGCSIVLLQEDGALVTVAADGQHAGAKDRRRRHEPERGGVSEAIATRKPALIRTVDDAVLVRLARDDEDLAWLRSFGLRSILALPLLAGERVLGAIALTSRSRSFDDVDVTISSELASRVASALENARLYEEAKAARREAESANRAKDEFLAVLGHELRNPLAPISTAVQLMRLRAPGEAKREREVIERQVTHLSRLVDDLLDVSRIARGKVELRRERTTIATVVSSAVELTSHLLEDRGHHLAIEVPPDLTAFADPARLRQMVANLLSNAAKHTAPGGNIGVVATREDGFITLTVRDDGAGIDPSMLPRIFDSFVQAPQPSARSAGGLGLGLTIVKNLVELHGGQVSAHSQGAGKGASVTFTVPEHEPGARPPSSVPRPPSSPMRRRVLVVDDNEDAALLLRELLDAHGHEARTAFDGPSALRLAEEFRPHVAVVDIGLPVMDGYEVAERLRSSPTTRALRLIALTGYGAASDRQRAFGAGFDAHLTKPVSIDKLVQLFEATISPRNP